MTRKPLRTSGCGPVNHDTDIYLVISFLGHKDILYILLRLSQGFKVLHNDIMCCVISDIISLIQ